MDYGSSYAIGGSPLGHDDAARHQHAHVDAVVLPPPPPQRMHWSTLVFVGGMCVCALGLLLTIAGVPASTYDVDGAPNRNKPSSNDPMALTNSLDGNMKWIDQQSADAKGGYVGYIQSINRNEIAIPAMVQALVAMDASVKSLDTGLAGMGDVTAQMGADMQAMAEVSAKSGATMSALGDDIGFLSKSMVELATSTEQLTERMANIEAAAAGIAKNGTAAALTNTKELNASLPDNVPVPTTTDGEPLDQAMQRLASGGGGSSSAAGAVDGMAVAQ